MMMSDATQLRQSVPVFTRVYNENTYSREASNGRIYEGVLGWRWYPHLLGKRVGDPDGYKTMREAKEAALKIKDRGYCHFDLS